MQLVHNQTYQAISLPIVATLWCIAVTHALIAGQFYAERRYARGSARGLPPTPLQRPGPVSPHCVDRATAPDARRAVDGDW
ncbi:hypothetical protein [Streptomyces herbicida]|uniref:hypothetical protein n=1 Tax=Streptomyces herbicida TaxID=3065675 RepID=UPI0038CD649E